MELRQRLCAHLLELFLAGPDVELQLLEVGEILVVEPVEEHDVLHHLEARLLERTGDALDLHRELLVALLDIVRLVDETAEKRHLAQEAALALLVVLLDLSHEAAEQLADFAAVLRAHLREDAVRERRDLLLRGRAVRQERLGVRHVDAVLDLFDFRQFLRRQCVDSRFDLALDFLRHDGLRLGALLFLMMRQEV